MISLLYKLPRGVALLAASVLLLAPIMEAQAKWPERVIKIIIPFGAGGVGDVTSRIMADKLSEKLGQQVIIENMPGPGGINAARAVTTSSPDGYTMGLVANGTAISVGAFKSLPFDAVKDFEMISMISEFDLMFVVSTKSEYKTLGDFTNAAKEAPGKLNIGTIAVGGSQNLAAELLKSEAGINVQIVPYKRSPDTVVALLRNEVQMIIDFLPAVQGQVDSGDLKILASSSFKRSAMLPNVPTAQEAGIKDFVVTGWNGIFVPKGTPKEVIDTMSKAIHEVLAMEDVKKKFSKAGVEAHASNAAELETRLADDIKKWTAVIEKAGIPKK